jgi:hypothetical protein
MKRAECLFVMDVVIASTLELLGVWRFLKFFDPVSAAVALPIRKAQHSLCWAYSVSMMLDHPYRQAT